MARVTAALLTGLIVLSVGSLGLSNAASSTSAESNSKKIICYYPSWAAYRPGDGKFGPEDIDPTLCTHVVYSFAGLDNKTLTIEALDSKLDIDRGYYEKTVALRKKGIKVMLAIGGWSDSEGNKYSRLVNNATSRAQFVSNVTQFLEKYCFDGLDLDWEYPVCWQTDCTAGAASDNAGFASLVRELRTAFEPRGWLLSAAVSANRNVANVAYDVKILSEDLDWIGVMAYDYHGSYDGQTGHNSPLYYYPGDTPTYFNVNSSIWHYIEMGASRDKLVLGLPLYGQSFTLEDVNKHSLHDKTKGPGVAGELTQAASTLAFSEICYNVTKQGGWSVVRDPEGRIGPYAYRGDQWVSYDDTEDLKRKSRFALDLGLGGVMVWALGSDDFTNRCGCGKQPLLTAINDEIRGQTGTAKNCT